MHSVVKVKSLYLVVFLTLMLNGILQAQVVNRFENAREVNIGNLKIKITPSLAIGDIRVGKERVIDGCYLFFQGHWNKKFHHVGLQFWDKGEYKEVKKDNERIFSIDISPYATKKGLYYTYKEKLTILPFEIKIHYEVEILKDIKELSSDPNAWVTCAFIVKFNKDILNLQEKPVVQKGEVIYATKSGKLISLTYNPNLNIARNYIGRGEIRIGKGHSKYILKKGERIIIDVKISLPSAS